MIKMAHKERPRTVRDCRTVFLLQDANPSKDSVQYAGVSERLSKGREVQRAPTPIVTTVRLRR